MTVANTVSESPRADPSQAGLETLMLELARVRDHMLNQADSLIEQIRAVHPRIVPAP